MMKEATKDQPYKLDATADHGGGFHGQTVTCSYDKLVKAFGPPNSEGDAYKISTEWCFSDASGNAFTIYDWKMTELYDEEHLPTVEELRASRSVTWNIGGDDRSIRSFVLWAKGRIAGYR